MQPSAQNSHQIVVVGALPTLRLTLRELADVMVRDCLNAREEKNLPKLVFSSNGQSVSMAGRDPEFRALMQKADIIHADGMSIVFASKFFTDMPLPERIATTDFFHEAARSGEENGLRFFLLGGQKEQVAKSFEMAQHLYPGVKWVGQHHGFFEEDEEAAVVEKILAAKPDVLWVGLGRPRQEIFCTRNQCALAGVGWIKTCGGLFDFLAGSTKRAPVWLQRIGLEWFWRILQEPRRLLWRYVTTNLDALWRLARYSGKM